MRRTLYLHTHACVGNFLAQLPTPRRLAGSTIRERTAAPNTRPARLSCTSA